MLALVGTVLVTSFLDSLNPSAIAQELLLLAIAPRKHDVWWFIIGIALANLALGLAIYLGIAALVTEVFFLTAHCLSASCLCGRNNCWTSSGCCLHPPCHTSAVAPRSTCSGCPSQTNKSWSCLSFFDGCSILRCRAHKRPAILWLYDIACFSTTPNACSGCISRCIQCCLRSTSHCYQALLHENA